MDEEEKKKLWLFGGQSSRDSNCGISCALSAASWSPSHSVVSARLAVKSEALAKYFGQQFIDIWSDYVALPHKLRVINKIKTCDGCVYQERKGCCSYPGMCFNEKGERTAYFEKEFHNQSQINCEKFVSN